MSQLILLFSFMLLTLILPLSLSCSPEIETTSPPVITIDLAPIEEVTVNFMESNPVQVGVYIRGGLRDGCTTFHDVQTSREGNTININVTTQRPRDAVCPAVYNIFEKYINLGTDFVIGVTYALNVNDYKTTFTYY